ncbi:hypothetical protein AQU20_03975 [Escherichia albertii]|nr:hypothetical protein AQU20_03975 [Escherichia albertii]
MFERSVGNAKRRVNVTSFCVWACSENCDFALCYCSIFIMNGGVSIILPSRKLTKKSITISLYFFKQFLKNDARYR